MCGLVTDAFAAEPPPTLQGGHVNRCTFKREAKEKRVGTPIRIWRKANAWYQVPTGPESSRAAWLLIALLVANGHLQSAFGDAGAADVKPDECGIASIYSSVSEKTASGEDTRPEDLTAAHRSLPFGTLVQVNNRENGHSAVVRITDRGPFTGGRIIDVSQIAARELGFSGLTQVCLNILVIPESQPAEVN